MGLVAWVPTEASAQRGDLQGLVRDSTGQPVASADVGIVALRQLTRTDDSGRFVFNRLITGPVEISVRRLGYLPRTVHALITDAAVASISVTLEAQPTVLQAENITASDRRQREGIEDFYRRRTHGIGTFITREQIVARNSFSPSDMLRTTPGIRFVRAGLGKGVRFNNTSMSRRDCMPMIWIDGQRAPGMELDDLPLTDVEGIELYQGPSTTPLQFSQSTSMQTCGTIVIWSRPPQTARERP